MLQEGASKGVEVPPGGEEFGADAAIFLARYTKNIEKQVKFVRSPVRELNHSLLHTAVWNDNRM